VRGVVVCALVRARVYLASKVPTGIVGVGGPLVDVHLPLNLAQVDRTYDLVKPATVETLVSACVLSSPVNLLIL